MKKIKKIKIIKYSNKTGSLIPITFNKKIPLNVKIIFFIYGKKNKTRGNHAHKKSNQLFIHVSGTIILNIFSKKNKKKFVLNAKNKKLIFVPPMYWCNVKFVKNNSVLMVVSDRKYETNDYIRNYNEYLRKVK